MKKILKNMLPKLLIQRLIRLKNIFGSIDDVIYNVIWLYKRKKISEEKFIFIVGSGHCGTSILHRVLGYHPQIFDLPNETWWFVDGLYAKSKKEIISVFNIKRLFSFTAVLEKTPNHLHEYYKLQNLFKNPKFIIIVRDPRDVVSSFVSRGVSFDKALSRWIKAAELTREIMSMENVRVIKLEEFVVNTKKIIFEIQEFCDIQYFPLDELQGKIPKFYYSDDINKPSEVNNEVSHRKNRNWQINQPIFKETSRYKNNLNEDQINEVVLKTYKIAKDLGYSL